MNHACVGAVLSPASGRWQGHVSPALLSMMPQRPQWGLTWHTRGVMGTSTQCGLPQAGASIPAPASPWLPLCLAGRPGLGPSSTALGVPGIHTRAEASWRSLAQPSGCPWLWQAPARAVGRLSPGQGTGGQQLTNDPELLAVLCLGFPSWKRGCSAAVQAWALPPPPASLAGPWVLVGGRGLQTAMLLCLPPAPASEGEGPSCSSVPGGHLGWTCDPSMVDPASTQERPAPGHKPRAAVPAPPPQPPRPTHSPPAGEEGLAPGSEVRVPVS